MRRRGGRRYFSSLLEVKQLARHLLRKYKHCGAPVVLMMRGWAEGGHLAALARGPHKSAIKQAPFLREEFN